ncbi:MAG: YggS family pyridoxal phosphate-dependent enzyme [Oceanicoccus sp.]
MQQSIALNIAKVRERIRNAEEIYQRKPNAVTLMAVSKTRSANEIRQAIAAGATDIGENYLQEALDKQQHLADINVCWHFIGPIQSNKTRAIAEHFDWVHSVDRLKIAQRLSNQRPSDMPSLNVCLQVNTSGEASKAGVSLNELSSLAAEVDILPRIRLRGLMSIPEASQHIDEQKAAFAVLQQAFINLQKTCRNLDTLSMGMSADMEAAIAEGSTMVRIGTDLFGPR